MYTQVWTVIDEAVDEEHDISGTPEGDAKLGRLIVEWGTAARDEHLTIEVYMRFHQHEMGVECECHQYDQDHTPAFILNGAETA